jgi:ABC-type transporter Mla MlaB component
MLRITVQDGSDRVTFRLEGNLAGAWVKELEDCWRSTSADLAGRPLSVDLTAVTRVDSAGKYLLALLCGAGAELIGSGTATALLLEQIAADWPGNLKKRRGAAYSISNRPKASPRSRSGPRTVRLTST